MIPRTEREKMLPFLPHLFVSICLASNPVPGAGGQSCPSRDDSWPPGANMPVGSSLVKQHKTDKKEVALNVKSLPYPTRIKLLDGWGAGKASLVC